jgi:hypothetical protein
MIINPKQEYIRVIYLKILSLSAKLKKYCPISAKGRINIEVGR